ncbi:MAG: hypothetical protein WAT39_02255 [Planctomycetota bacterium]
MKARLYLDASAYFSVLVRGEQSRQLETELRGAHLMSSVVLVLEVQRNLVRLVREKAISADQYLAMSDAMRATMEVLRLREVTLDLCLPAAMPAAVLPRSLDLIHLRTAQWFHAEEPLTRFVSLDRAQNHAARELGLPV